LPKILVYAIGYWLLAIGYWLSLLAQGWYSFRRYTWRACIGNQIEGMRMSRQLASRRVSGVTLIELMIVVAILGVISAIAIPIYSDYIETAKKTAMQVNIRNIVFLMDGYARDEGSYPREPLDPTTYLQGDALLAELRWAKSANDSVSYTVTNVTTTGYLVTATHPDGTLETN
jgi:type IV pilus assembly protein PilA